MDIAEILFFALILFAASIGFWAFEAFIAVAFKVMYR